MFCPKSRKTFKCQNKFRPFPAQNLRHTKSFHRLILVTVAGIYVVIVVGKHRRVETDIYFDNLGTMYKGTYTAGSRKSMVGYFLFFSRKSIGSPFHLNNQPYLFLEPALYDVHYSKHIKIRTTSNWSWTGGGNMNIYNSLEATHSL